MFPGLVEVQTLSPMLLPLFLLQHTYAGGEEGKKAVEEKIVVPQGAKVNVGSCDARRIEVS